MKSLLEVFFTSLGGAVVVYYGVKLLLVTKMLYPKMWFPLPKSFFSSMGEWAVVTGASEGIGREYAFALAEQGMNVVIMSRTKATLEQLAKEIGEATSRTVKVLVADFTEDKVFGDIEEQLKDLNIGVLVNNVGMLPSNVPKRFLEDTDLDQMCKTLLPGMENRGKGVIINVSSGIACIPFPMYSLYAASKIFVERFSQGLQAEYKEKGMLIQAVTPFGVSTRMIGYQATDMVTLSPRDFVKSSLQYLRAGDRTYGSICHMFLGWLIRSTPRKILYADSVLNGLQEYVEKKQAKTRSISTLSVA
ncbi:17-beta-hydroxysteroid dehydrogenase type 3 isoform X2 [Nerophis ophidion]|uniref:17-beta-hydroxysteroid dehydrogenase type 3 isoform X2 n=1 Tax=Nerophis ophidion TaxID=159077 RepID=UPI002ADFB672|nr:17-beta-hydroxysteroid dehydrogenase type 3 isoform X2 [Nerophis ophidion]